MDVNTFGGMQVNGIINFPYTSFCAQVLMIPFVILRGLQLYCLSEVHQGLHTV